MPGELRSEFSFTGTYPLATLVDRDLLKQNGNARNWRLRNRARNENGTGRSTRNRERFV